MRLEKDITERNEESGTSSLVSADAETKKPPIVEDVRTCRKCSKRVDWLNVDSLEEHWKECPHGRPESIWSGFITIRPEIMRFAQRMEEVMRENDKNKGDSWKDMPEFDLLDLLKKEFKEIEEGDEKEFADVGNFCMMLWNRDMFSPVGRGDNSSGLIKSYIEKWERIHGQYK